MTDDLKRLAEAAHALRYHDTLEAAKAKVDFQNAADAATVLALIRERDEARKQVNGLRLSQSLDKDSAYVIRELLNRHNVPAAAFIDDHVANAIAQRDAAEAALAKRDEEVARLRETMQSASVYLRKLEDNMLANDADMMLDDCLPPSFHADQIDQALTKEPTNAE